MHRLARLSRERMLERMGVVGHDLKRIADLGEQNLQSLLLQF
jgi:hypothetical protein